MLMMHANNGCCRQSVLDCFFFICQFVADVGWLSHPLSCAAVVHDKIPLGSVMKWCSRQVIIISLPSVVDCYLFYFVVCCCILLHAIVCCCMIDALFKMDFDNSMMQACCYDGCWMLKQWMMHVDDACQWWRCHVKYPVFWRKLCQLSWLGCCNEWWKTTMLVSSGFMVI
jgi:hypothetical protein